MWKAGDVMIVWKPFDMGGVVDKEGVLQTARDHASRGRYVFVSFVPGSGWGGAYGVWDGRQVEQKVVITNLLQDQHVTVFAISNSDSGDNPNNGGPHRAA